MKRTATLLAATAAVAIATLPAAAQQAQGDQSEPQGLTWQDVTTPSIRFVQRDAEGNVLFDSAAMDAAPGATDPEMAEAIRRADAPTTGETDAAGEGMEMGAADTAEAPGTAEAYTQSERRDQLAFGNREMHDDTGNVEAFADRAADGTEMPGEGSAMAGDLSATDMLVSPTGEAMDMDAFARELYAEGYRQGYVSGLTRMRAAAARQMMGERDRFDQYRTRAEARSERQSREMQRMRQGSEAATRTGQPMMQRQGDGTTIITLPAGMTPQEFLRMISQ